MSALIILILALVSILGGYLILVLSWIITLDPLILIGLLVGWMILVWMIGGVSSRHISAWLYKSGFVSIPEDQLHLGARSLIMLLFLSLGLIGGVIAVISTPPAGDTTPLVTPSPQQQTNTGISTLSSGAIQTGSTTPETMSGELVWTGSEMDLEQYEELFSEEITGEVTPEDEALDFSGETQDLLPREDTLMIPAPTVSSGSTADPYEIISPSSDLMTVTGSSLVISGRVPAKIIQYIEINGTRMKEYEAYSDSWIARVTLKNEENPYTLNFYDKSGVLVEVKTFTILKQQ